MENFLTILSGFLTPVIAGAMLYIAYRQYKTDREKFRWNLYDKRMEVYQSLWDLLGYIMQKADVSYEELNKFTIKKEKGCFLFGSDINDYLSEIRDKGFLLHKYMRQLDDRGLGIGKRRDKLAEEEEEIMLWFGKQYEESKRLFEKYLKIEK